MQIFAQPFFAPRPLAGKTVAQLTLASFSGVAAGIHGWVVPGHIEEYPLFGAFFAVVAISQAGWALAVLRRPSPRLGSAGIALSAGLIGVWALSRTVGLPIGPEPWEVEQATLIDVAAGLAELGIILVAGFAASGARRGRRR